VIAIDRGCLLVTVCSSQADRCHSRTSCRPRPVPAFPPFPPGIVSVASIPQGEPVTYRRGRLLCLAALVLVERWGGRRPATQSVQMSRRSDEVRQAQHGPLHAGSQTSTMVCCAPHAQCRPPHRTLYGAWLCRAARTWQRRSFRVAEECRRRRRAVRVWMGARRVRARLRLRLLEWERGRQAWASRSAAS
jgi:hypothetical protein